MERIIQQKISADHLLYSSLKYTKTTDVILNLLFRWSALIEESINRILEKAKKTKKIKAIPAAPRMKIETALQIYKNDEDIVNAIKLYIFLKKAETAEKIRENEFRKNVTLKIMYLGKWETVDLEKLKEYNIIIEQFVNRLKNMF